MRVIRGMLLFAEQMKLSNFPEMSEWVGTRKEREGVKSTIREFPIHPVSIL